MSSARLEAFSATASPCSKISSRAVFATEASLPCQRVSGWFAREGPLVNLAEPRTSGSAGGGVCEVVTLALMLRVEVHRRDGRRSLSAAAAGSRPRTCARARERTLEGDMRVEPACIARARAILRGGKNPKSASQRRTPVLCRRMSRGSIARRRAEGFERVVVNLPEKGRARNTAKSSAGSRGRR